MATRTVEREHQLTAQALTERMVGYERFELADEVSVATEREVSVYSVFKGEKTKFFESGSFACGERLRDKLGQGGATPELESPAKRSGSCRRPPADKRVMRVGELELEAMQVKFLGQDLE